MGDDIFSSHGESLEEIVLLMLGMRDLKLAVAESMTGGLLSQRLTAIPNASRSFHGGAVVYASEQKTNLAKVPFELIQQARRRQPGGRPRPRRRHPRGHRLLARPQHHRPRRSRRGEGPDAGKPVGLVYIGFADGEDTR